MAKQKQVSQHDIEQAWMEAFIERHGGRISPKILVEEASDPSCPLHDRFEWDDDVAARQFRLAQAGQIIRQWKGVLLRVDTEAKQIRVEPVRRVQSPEDSRGKGRASYETVEEIMADPGKRDSMIRTVLRELNAYRKRYADILALSEVWAAIDAAVDLHDGGPGKGAGKSERRPRA
jgi:hypothetical protein